MYEQEHSVPISGPLNNKGASGLRQPLDVYGGPTRTRTWNQTVMSGRL